MVLSKIIFYLLQHGCIGAQPPTCMCMVYTWALKGQLYQVFWLYLDPKVCRILACWASAKGVEPLFYILLGSRYLS